METNVAVCIYYHQLLKNCFRANFFWSHDLANSLPEALKKFKYDSNSFKNQYFVHVLPAVIFLLFACCASSFPNYLVNFNMTSKHLVAKISLHNKQEHISVSGMCEVWVVQQRKGKACVLETTTPSTRKSLYADYYFPQRNKITKLNTVHKLYDWLHVRSVSQLLKYKFFLTG